MTALEVNIQYRQSSAAVSGRCAISTATTPLSDCGWVCASSDVLENNNRRLLRQRQTKALSTAVSSSSHQRSSIFRYLTLLSVISRKTEWRDWLSVAERGRKTSHRSRDETIQLTTVFSHLSEQGLGRQSTASACSSRVKRQYNTQRYADILCALIRLQTLALYKSFTYLLIYLLASKVPSRTVELTA